MRHSDEAYDAARDEPRRPKLGHHFGPGCCSHGRSPEEECEVCDHEQEIEEEAFVRNQDLATDYDAQHVYPEDDPDYEFDGDR